MLLSAWRQRAAVLLRLTVPSLAPLASRRWRSQATAAARAERLAGSAHSWDLHAHRGQSTSFGKGELQSYRAKLMMLTMQAAATEPLCYGNQAATRCS